MSKKAAKELSKSSTEPTKKDASETSTSQETAIPYEEKIEPVFRFKSENGTLTAIPKTGEVNAIKLEQAKRTDWLFTRLPKELALKYTSAVVMTPYGEAKGDHCVIATKYRGDAIDADRPEEPGDCYTLLFTPFYAERNANLTKIDEGIKDSDIKHSLLALDESLGLQYRNKFLIEKEMRQKELEYHEGKDYDFRDAVTRTATTVVDDVALGEKSVEREVSLFNMDRVTRWLSKNKLWVIIGIATIIIIISFFQG